MIYKIFVEQTFRLKDLLKPTIDQYVFCLILPGGEGANFPFLWFFVYNL